MQWHTLQQDLGKTRQGEETREEAGAGRKVVWRVHAEAKKKRKWRENAESGGEKQWVGQRLRKGTDVLRRIRPYAHVVDTSHRHSLCQACFIPQDKKLKRCAGCKVYYYCSAACQKADWTDHKKECHSLQQVCFVPCASK